MQGNPTDRFFENLDGDPATAGFYWMGGPVRVAERTWHASAFSGVTAFETDEGIVLVDTGTKFFAPQIAERIRQVTDRPVTHVVYTHGHVDHAYGTQHFLVDGQSPPEVYANEQMLERFERYARTPRHNSMINMRQFGGTGIGANDESSQALDTFEQPSHPPTVTYRAPHELAVGELTFELHPARGETDDHTWVYCPERGVLCPGDLMIWALPNGGNPQKAQRYPWDWAAALREMAAREPRSLAPGHGGPVVDDPEMVNQILTSTAELLEQISEQTIAALEDGSPPHVDIVHAVHIEVPDLPWLAPIYDDPEFLVRNVIRYFGGWWTGRPSELKPAPRAAVASEVANLAGGVEALITRMREVAAGGDLRLARHLADWAMEATPDDMTVQAAVAELYESSADGESSLMGTNLFRSAAEYARAGRSFA